MPRVPAVVVAVRASLLGATNVAGRVLTKPGCHCLAAVYLQDKAATRHPSMGRPCRPAVVVLLVAALLSLGSGSAAAPCAASAAATVAAARSALGPFKSWQEAWAALSPYGPPPTNGSAPPTVAACGGLTVRSKRGVGCMLCMLRDIARVATIC